MAEIAGATITYTDYTGTPTDPRLLNVPDVYGDVPVQDLVDTLSAKQAELDALIYDPLLDIPDTSGKQVLSATKSVGITCVSVRTQVKFEDLGGPAYTIKRIIDGNFVSIDNEVDRNQIEEMANSTFVNWKTEADVSAALLNPVVAVDLTSVETLVDRNADLIESQRGSHTWHGDTWYVDPVNGNDGNTGGRIDPFATFTAAHTAATDGNHDVIFLVAGGVGITELDEQVTITKRLLFVRGPGIDFRWKSTTAGDVVQVQADGVELSGFRVQTHTVGAGRGIDADGADSLYIHHVWVERSQSDGIRLLNCNNAEIRFCLLEDVGTLGSGDGIAVNGSTGGQHNHIFDNRIYATQGDGISVQGANIDHTTIQNNHIHESEGWAINITSDATKTIITRNHLGLNTLGPINDGGIDTLRINNEQWAKQTYLNGRLEVDIASQELILYDMDGVTILQRWPVETTGGEPVTTAIGVQTKRKAPLL